MSRGNLSLSRLVFALFGVAVALLAVEEVCGWMAMTRLAKDAKSLKGRPFGVLFERAPVLPDRIVFDSLRSDAIVFSYDEWRWRWKRYPGMDIVSVGGIIVDVRVKN